MEDRLPDHPRHPGVSRLGRRSATRSPPWPSSAGSRGCSSAACREGLRNLGVFALRYSAQLNAYTWLLTDATRSAARRRSRSANTPRIRRRLEPAASGGRGRSSRRRGRSPRPGPSPPFACGGQACRATSAAPNLDPHRYFSDAELDRASSYEALLRDRHLLLGSRRRSPSPASSRFGERDSSASPRPAESARGCSSGCSAWRSSGWRSFHSASRRSGGTKATTSPTWTTSAGSSATSSCRRRVPVHLPRAPDRHGPRRALAPSVVGRGRPSAPRHRPPVRLRPALPAPRPPSSPRPRAGGRGTAARARRGCLRHPGTRSRRHRYTGGSPNAEAVGARRPRRVIVWDTLRRRFPPSEVRVVLAARVRPPRARPHLKGSAWWRCWPCRSPSS